MPLKIISVFNFGAINMALNHLTSLRNIGIKDNISYVTDSESFNLLKSMGHEVELINHSETNPNFNDFGTEEFNKLSYIRYFVIKSLLKKGFDVWYLDTDTVLTKDIRIFYSKNDCDILIQDDINMPCTGCALYFSGRNTEELVENMIINRNNQFNDQLVFRSLISTGRYNIKFLPHNSFPNGLLFFNKILQPETTATFKNEIEDFEKNKNVFFVHANWMIGESKKTNALKKYNLWYLYHKDTKVFSDFSLGKINNIPEPCFIMVDKPDIFSENIPNIYVQVEPTAILDVEEYLIQNHKKYHTIFTFNQNILNRCPNSRKYIYGTTWIEKKYYENIDLSKKNFSISSLSGSKLLPNAPGHKLRQTLYHSQKCFSTFPITFYRSLVQLPHLVDYGKNPFINNKTELFETHQFAIVIENSRQTNYFTEKIMDCLLTKTIPIYWGCPNISEFFDTTGWIIAETESVDEFLKKMEVITEDYYERYSHIVEANFLKAQKYTDFVTNLNSTIYSLPKLFYINLEYRKDRNSHILSELEKVEYPLSCIERVEAIYRPENGALGCTESHLKTLELAKSMEGDVFIILEDDFSFYEPETFLGNLEYVLNLEMDWKVCLLSSNTDIKLPLNERICRILNSQTTSGYIVKKDYIDKLIETFEESRRKFLNGDPKEKVALDILWKQDQLNSFWISFNRKIGFQVASYSDVEGYFVNYGV